MDLDIQELYDMNTGWRGPIEMEPDPDAILPAAYLYNIETREERQQHERAQRGILLHSVDEVLSTLATLFETAHGARVSLIEAVAHLCPKVRGWGYNLVITPLAPKKVIGKVGRVI